MEPELDEDSAKSIGKECYLDPVLFCNLFVAHWFKGQSPTWYQRAILAILTRKTGFLSKYGELDLIYEFFTWTDDDENVWNLFQWNEDKTGLTLEITPFTLIMIPRGFSKTTTINAFVLWNCAYTDFHFPVYISETQTHAETQLANIRLELETNARFLGMFGSLKPEQRKGMKWTGDILQLANGVVIGARGRGGQIRGMLVNAKRPDLLIPDDVEDKESVKTEDQRDKALSWFYGDVIQALPRGEANVGIVALGTLLHSEALLAKLAINPEWNAIVLGVSLTRKDGTTVPLWNDARYGMTLDQIEKKKLSFARVGKLNLFYMEYFNTIRGEEGQKFRPEHILVPSLFDPTDFPYRALACDPAISEEPGADYFALGVVGRAAKGGRIAVLDVWGEKGVSPSDQAELFFEWRKRWGKPRFNGVESIAYQRALAITIREMMFRKGDYFEMIEIKHARVKGKQQPKDERINGILHPRYHSGYMIHARHFPLYETQLFDFPNGKKDLPDVIAMCIALLDPMAALAAGEDVDLTADQYEPLDKILGPEYLGAP
jgi:hypothetical protein|tara:strand:+ start:4291 stop:5931 length:1641 start_codon:yes stop_codon:yes gene_type:complete